jgi:hypothetical protein
MTANFDQLREIFLAALERAPEERNAYVNLHCAGDEALRHNVAVMLKAHAVEEGPLDRGALRDQQTRSYEQATERPGTVIGPYKLLEQIGEGGFGVVFMAEQEKPLRRKVALKVLKPGMDTHQVVARFEAERQALALMDHANIAKIHDAGTTASGRPYFVMELVRGVPITDFCDQRRLTTRQRLELFVTVCRAVQLFVTVCRALFATTRRLTTSAGPGRFTAGGRAPPTSTSAPATPPTCGASRRSTRSP